MLLKLVEEIALKEFASRDSAFSRFKKSAVAQAKRINSVEEIKKAVDKVDGYVCEIDTDRSVSIFADNDRGYLFKIDVVTENSEGTSYSAEVKNWSGRTVRDGVLTGLKVGGADDNIDTCEKAAGELVNIVSNNIIKADDLIKGTGSVEESLNEGKIKDLFIKASKSMMGRIGDAGLERDTHKNNKDFFKKLSGLLSTKMEASSYTCQAVEDKKALTPGYSFYINSKKFKKPLIFRLLFDYSDSGKEGSLKLSSIEDCMGNGPNNLSNISVLKVLQKMGEKLGVNFVFDSKAALATGSSENEVKNASYSTTTGALVGVRREIAGAVQQAMGESLREDLFLQEAEGSGGIDYDALNAVYKNAKSGEMVKILEYISKKVWGEMWGELVESDEATPLIIKALGDNLNPGVGGTFSYFMRKYFAKNKLKITGNMATLFNNKNKFFNAESRDDTVLIPAFWNNTDDKEALANVLLYLKKIKSKNSLKIPTKGDALDQLTKIYKINPEDKENLFDQIIYRTLGDKSTLRPLEDIQKIIKLFGTSSSSYGSYEDEEDDFSLDGSSTIKVTLKSLIGELKRETLNTEHLTNFLKGLKPEKIKKIIPALISALETLQRRR